MIIEIGSIFKHRQNNLKVRITDIQYTKNCQVVWFIFNDDDDYYPQHYTRTTKEFISKFEICLSQDAKETIDSLICQYGPEAVLNYSGTIYKNILNLKG